MALVIAFALGVLIGWFGRNLYRPRPDYVDRRSPYLRR